MLELNLFKQETISMFVSINYYLNTQKKDVKLIWRIILV